MAHSNWLAGETPPITVNKGDHHLLPGSMCPIRVKANSPLGCLVLIRLHLEAETGFPDLDWHCSRVEVCRLADRQAEEGGEGGTAPEDPEVQVFLCDRWRKFLDGAPQCVDLNSMSELGPNLNYTHQSKSNNLHFLRGFVGRVEAWSFTELDTIFAHSGHQNKIARFVKTHWMEDWYFGYQCLNGCNPLLVRQTRILPPNLSITSDMIHPFLPEGSSLEQELQKGTVYLLNYEILDGVPANMVNGEQTYLCAPLCLLHLNQQGQLLPIAIQLQQTPGPQNPVFLPSDGCDWLLAKIWVHSADFQCHQLSSHYLRTHMLGEMCCVATLRQLPEIHPLHQLLMPHVRTSLQINIQARGSLLATNGVFDKAIGSGLEALPVVISQASKRICYRALCVPDDLIDRGVDKLPQCYYAQDALRSGTYCTGDKLCVCVCIRFVVNWVNLYYIGDDDVQQDSELQHWITDINTHGFRQDAGLPQSLQTKAELSKFVTMIIFSCSALHAAVNFSQVPLCHYTEAIFREDAHRQLVGEVQAELKALSDNITERNSKLELPYAYLCPEHIENSIAI
ncbi:Arachidonate 12-lipoxygenase, 12R-type [Larimichthys crocea]|uniref:Arachidonate 12-lipoxygenase, 12R-type n=1 Tax=Larimichthys crocea TaxID=215358 RepID=A0A6G0I939_LARCR|nr:Arachidonate 12-lipoxygenase, 12R-type [Larimichthys crocea]